MELKILNERANPLLKRVEYQFEVTHVAASTPSLDEVRAELSKQLKVSKDRLVVERMNAKFGAPRTQGEALAYTNADAVKKISREHILIRNKLKEKPTTGPATPSETPAAAPTPAAEAPAPEKEKPAAKEAPAKEPAHKEAAHKEASKEKGAEKPAAEKGAAKGKGAKSDAEKKE
jgi:small subunit ribosomal protein S24e